MNEGDSLKGFRNEEDNQLIVLTISQLQEMCCIAAEEAVESKFNENILELEERLDYLENILGGVNAFVTSKRRYDEKETRPILQLIERLRRIKYHNEAIPYEAVIEKAHTAGIEIEAAKKALDTLRRDGTIFEPKPGYIKLL
jgi:hypothetical protein